MLSAQSQWREKVNWPAGISITACYRLAGVRLRVLFPSKLSSLLASSGVMSPLLTALVMALPVACSTNALICRMSVFMVTSSVVGFRLLALVPRACCTIKGADVYMQHKMSAKQPDTDNHAVGCNRVGQRFSDIESPHFFEIAVQRNHVADAIRHIDATKKVARSDVFNYIEMYSYPRRRYGLNNQLSLVEYEAQYQKTDDEGLAIRGRFIYRCSGRLILLFHIHRIAGSSMGKGPKGIFLVLFLNPKMFLGSEYRTESTCFYALCSEPTCDQSPIS